MMEGRGAAALFVKNLPPLPNSSLKELFTLVGGSDYRLMDSGKIAILSFPSQVAAEKGISALDGLTV
jgi:hypothetical protein